MAKAHFIRFYGAAEYRGPQWQTRDHVIPWHLFWTEYRAMRHAYALERFNLGRGVSLGIAMAIGNQDELSRRLEAIMNEAFPEA